MADLLGKSIALNSDWAPGYAFLAEVNTDLDQAGTALGMARRAVALEPRVSTHHLAVARALARLSKPDEAVQEAEKAVALARNPGERGRAEEMLAYLKRVAKQAGAANAADGLPR
jgi:tetratricopeptide (TPR) repeat protein